MFNHNRKHKSHDQAPRRERRWMQRLQVHSSAVIHNQDNVCQECIITCINANGMLISAKQTHLSPGAFTTVELALDCEDGVKYQPETVRVVHVNYHQVAVAFVDYSSSHLRSFQKLLQTENRNQQNPESVRQHQETIYHLHRYR